MAVALSRLNRTSTSAKPALSSSLIKQNYHDAREKDAVKQICFCVCTCMQKCCPRPQVYGKMLMGSTAMQTGPMFEPGTKDCIFGGVII